MSIEQIPTQELTKISQETVWYREGKGVTAIRVINGGAQDIYYTPCGIANPQAPTNFSIAKDLKGLNEQRNKLRCFDQARADEVWKNAVELAGLLEDPNSDKQKINDLITCEYNLVVVNSALGILFYNHKNGEFSQNDQA